MSFARTTVEVTDFAIASGLMSGVVMVTLTFVPVVDVFVVDAGCDVMTVFAAGRLRGSAGFAAFFAAGFFAGVFFATCFLAGCFFATGFFFAAMR